MPTSAIKCREDRQGRSHHRNRVRDLGVFMLAVRITISPAQFCALSHQAVASGQRATELQDTASSASSNYPSRFSLICAKCLFAISLLSLCSACASLQLSHTYIHSNAAQKAAESAQSGWQSSDPTKLFEDQKAYLSKLVGDEASTEKASIIARRDLQLISLMRGDGGTVAELRRRLMQLAGTFNTDSTTLKSLAPLEEKISQARTDLDLANLYLADARAEIVKDGFKDDVSDCSKINAPPPLPLPTDPEKADLLLVREACDEVSSAQQHISAALNSSFSADAAGRPAGELGSTIAEIAALQQEIQKQRTQSDNLNTALKTVQKQIDAAKDPKTADFAKAALKFCAADPDSSAESAAATPSNRTDLEAAFPACLTAAAKDVGPLVKLAKHSYTADQMQSVLTSILGSQAAATNGATSPSPQIAASTAAALGTLNLLTSAADDIAKNEMPSVNALLVALAYEQHEIAMNRLAAQAMQQQEAILEEKREALIDEIADLAIALQNFGPSSGDGTPATPGKNDTKVSILLAKNKEGAGQVLTEVASSWNVGRYRAELADYDLTDLVRRTSVAQASEVAGSWKNVLQPAFDELAAYGKGGLDAQTLASLAATIINAGGFSAVAARLGK